MTRNRVKSGEIDLVIGTHALIQKKDMQVQEAGLAVILTQYCFGVEQPAQPVQEARIPISGYDGNA